MVLGSTLAMILGLGFLSVTAAQGPDVQIVKLDCHTSPELVEVKNLGDAPQDLANWKLQSDPPQSEVFDLSAAGVLQPQASVTVQSGPTAGGVFKWSSEFVFRDGDTSDYARIVDDLGVVVHQVRCGGAAATPSPTPIPTPSAAGVPDGGGTPPAPGGNALLWPALLLLIGGSMIALSLASFTIPRLRPSPVVKQSATFEIGRRDRAKRPSRLRRRRGHGRERAFRPASGLALVGIAAMAVIVFLSKCADGGDPGLDSRP